jgi:anti-sigma B factor antagonist
VSEPPITIAITDHGEWRVLHVHGELDVETAPILRNACSDAVSEGHGSLIIDLSDVPFIDSSGLSVLISAQRVVRLAEGRLRLVTTVPATLRLLRVTGLDTAFDVRPDLENACADAVAGPG